MGLVTVGKNNNIIFSVLANAEGVLLRFLGQLKKVVIGLVWRKLEVSNTLVWTKL